MGFSIHYRTTRPITPAESDTIRRAAHAANEGRTWLSCEPVHFYRGEAKRLAEERRHPDELTQAERLARVRGVGPQTIDQLKRAGYGTVEDIAKEMDMAKLGAVEGVGIKKARQIKSAADPDTIGVAPEVPPNGSCPVPEPATADTEAPGAAMSGLMAFSL